MESGRRGTLVYLLCGTGVPETDCCRSDGKRTSTAGTALASGKVYRNTDRPLHQCAADCVDWQSRPLKAFVWVYGGVVGCCCATGGVARHDEQKRKVSQLKPETQNTNQAYDLLTPKMIAVSQILLAV